ncbi:MAG: HDOD domain-containing protein [Oligoflexia bacterium]|nr:HDOD domain-containing protein [Oligoflexia bacterium]
MTHSDMRGAELLRKVSQDQPLCVRIIAANGLDEADALEGIGVAHRVLVKDTEGAKIPDLIERAMMLRERLRSARLRKLLTKMTRLPNPPETFLAMQRLLEREEFHLQSLLGHLRKDVMLSAAVLKVANSSFFGARHPVESLDRAVNLLGVNTVKNVALSAELFAGVDKVRAKHFKLQQLFEHSTRVATAAASLARERKASKKICDLAYTAGLLHDVGKLIFVQVLPYEYRMVTERVGREFPSLYESEISAFGVSHQEVGAYVLSLWNIPEAVVEAVAYHHQPSFAPSREESVLTYVVAANLMDRGLADCLSADGEAEERSYLTQLGVPLVS